MNVLCRQTKRKAFLNYVSVKVFLYALCFLCFTFPVFAQSDVTFVGDDHIGMDVSLQFGGIRDEGARNSSEGHFGGSVLGAGLRAGYYLGSVFFLDGEVLYDPGVLDTDQKTVMLGGLRVGTVFDDKIGVFAKIRAGAINSKNILWGDPETNGTYPVVDIGIIVERYYENNFFARIDIGDDIIPIDDRIGTTHNLGMEFGLGFRF